MESVDYSPDAPRATIKAEDAWVKQESDLPSDPPRPLPTATVPSAPSRSSTAPSVLAATEFGRAVLRPRSPKSPAFSVSDESGTESAQEETAPMEVEQTASARPPAPPPPQTIPTTGATETSPAKPDKPKLTPPPTILVDFCQVCDYSNFHLDDLSRLFKDSLTASTHKDLTIAEKFSSIRNKLFKYVSSRGMYVIAKPTQNRCTLLIANDKQKEQQRRRSDQRRKHQVRRIRQEKELPPEALPQTSHPSASSTEKPIVFPPANQPSHAHKKDSDSMSSKPNPFVAAARRRGQFHKQQEEDCPAQQRRRKQPPASSSSIVGSSLKRTYPMPPQEPPAPHLLRQRREADLVRPATSRIGNRVRNIIQAKPPPQHSHIRRYPAGERPPPRRDARHRAAPSPPPPRRTSSATPPPVPPPPPPPSRPTSSSASLPDDEPVRQLVNSLITVIRSQR